MNIKKINELSGAILNWERALSDAKTKKAQLENDIFVAEREIASRKEELQSYISEVNE